MAGIGMAGRWGRPSAPYKGRQGIHGIRYRWVGNIKEPTGRWQA